MNQKTLSGRARILVMSADVAADVGVGAGVEDPTTAAGGGSENKESEVTDWVVVRQTMLALYGEGYEALMQQCLAMNEPDVVLLEKEPSWEMAHKLKGAARQLQLVAMGNAADAAERVLRETAEAPAGTAGAGPEAEVALFRRLHDDACREFGVDNGAKAADAAAKGEAGAAAVASPPE